MKLQYLAVIFVIIILPISLVLGFYMQAQIDIINLQTDYTSKLNKATYNAVKSFQLNTTNSYYSSVSDSKIRDIEASVNTFYNSLTDTLNYTKAELEAFVPAIVYTLYDGYYIYGKRYNVLDVERKSDEDTSKEEITKFNITTNVENTTNSDLYEYGLKPFVYYSCRYQDSKNDFVVNFTLDNFISIYGNVYCYNEQTKRVETHYVTKSGYLININKCEDITLSDGIATKVGKYKGAKIEENENLTEYLKFENGASNGIGDGQYRYVVYQNQKVYIKGDIRNGNYFWFDKGKAKLVNSESIINDIRANKYYTAGDYYKEAYNFSKWVETYIGGIKQENIKLANTNTQLEFNAGEKSIFNVYSEDPEDPSSTFNQHRRAVIKNAIETNLIAAINSYNTNAGSYAYALPKLNEEEWEKVVNNVCIISFMQGMPLGGKYFNNYVVIPNDINNEFVDIDSVYLLTNDGQYHLPNCPKLIEDENYQKTITTGYINTSFERQTIDEDYYYRHVKNNNVSQPYTQCYHCIVNSSAKYELEDIIDSSSNRIKGYDDKGKEISNNIELLRQKYLTALGREKYNLYKTNN